MRLLRILLVLLFLWHSARAQDLNAQVKVISGKIQTSNRHIFQSLENAMKDFLNGRKWCNDQILAQERFDCTFVLTLTNWDGNANFGGELQVQSSRPVFESMYNSPLVNVNDKDIDFTYNEGMTIDYTDQTFTSNLSSIMAFYAYMIIGMDYDSFSPFGGTVYFQHAQTVVINAQSSAAYKGWKAFDGNSNRYWFAENLNNKIYLPLRRLIYDYHRNGLDQMVENSSRGRKTISDLLLLLTQVDRQRLGAMFPLIFFTAKSDELVGILSKGDQKEKSRAVTLLTEADPANGNKYLSIYKN